MQLCGASYLATEWMDHYLALFTMLACFECRVVRSVFVGTIVDEVSLPRSHITEQSVSVSDSVELVSHTM